MSATVRWRPARVDGAVLHIDAPGNLREIFEVYNDVDEVEPTFELHGDDLPFLRSLEVAGIEVGAMRVLIKAVEKHGLIIVSWEY